MDRMIQLPTAGLIVLKDNKLLLAFSNNKNAWYLPGGKIDNNETSTQAIIREIKEEMNLDIDTTRLNYYCHITAPAYGEKADIIMEQECFMYDLQEEISPNNEIGGLKYFDLESYREEAEQASGVIKLFEKLIEGKLI